MQRRRRVDQFIVYTYMPFSGTKLYFFCSMYLSRSAHHILPLRCSTNIPRFLRARISLWDMNTRGSNSGPTRAFTRSRVHSAQVQCKVHSALRFFDGYVRVQHSSGGFLVLPHTQWRTQPCLPGNETHSRTTATAAMLVKRTLPTLLLASSSCHALHASPYISSPFHHHGTPTRFPNRPLQHLNMNMKPAEVPEKLRQANMKAHVEVWDSRRAMARATLSFAKSVRGFRESLGGPPDAAKDSLVEDGKGSLIVSAIALAIAAATVRLGGRAALISVRASHRGRQRLIYLS